MTGPEEIRAQLEAWAADDPFWIARSGVIPEHEGGDGSVFPDGGLATRCTSWSTYARLALGARAKLYGFFCEDNPSATAMARLADGHDFAVIDDRWIIDGWLFDVEGALSEPMIDMRDPANAELVRGFYGDPAAWERDRSLEVLIDGEGPQAFAAAMSDVMPTRLRPAPVPEM